MLACMGAYARARVCVGARAHVHACACVSTHIHAPSRKFPSSAWNVKPRKRSSIDASNSEFSYIAVMRLLGVLTLGTRSTHVASSPYSHWGTLRQRSSVEAIASSNEPS
jgi:hypothetical protein